MKKRFSTSLSDCVLFIALACTAICVSSNAIAASHKPFLSNLQATKDSPLYTTYAASKSRSNFLLDEGYHMIFYNDAGCVEFSNRRAGSLGLMFKLNDSWITRLKDFYAEPVITASYSDIVRFHYSLQADVRVDETFLVYTSRIAIRDVTIHNNSGREISIEIRPYLLDTLKLYHDIHFSRGSGVLTFTHTEFPDPWTKEHAIPNVDSVRDVIIQNIKPQGCFGSGDTTYYEPSTSFDSTHIVGVVDRIKIAPHRRFSVRILRGVQPLNSDFGMLDEAAQNAMKVSLGRFLREDEKLYSRVPRIRFSDQNLELLYWSGFSLLRQVMLPPEGKCHYNYYVFSREPQWGWGHGGQVFHESLAMLAYVFMDPAGAMASQRVYMERQKPDGYINYRTGPYLDETIPFNGELTTSAPWFSWENLEIFKVSRDRKFLSQAYIAGEKFYDYWLSERDSLHDGLCEWGGHAVLESVRDDQVAVWDQVGWPSRFEGPDLNSMLVREARSLQEMSSLLGDTNRAGYWKREAGRRAALVNKYMWDSTSSFYYNVNSVSKNFTYNKPGDLKRQEIIGFLPLWAGIPDSERAARLVSVLTDTSKFWRQFGIPSLAAADSYYNPRGYWNGPVWVEWNFLIEEGLREYGYARIAKALVMKVADGMMAQLKKDHQLWEFYDPDSEWAGYHTSYIWAGLISRMLMDVQK